LNIHLKALGCRLNEAELENWAREFNAAGHHIVNTAADADITVLNTCANRAS
jgi:threonylcarbamoyladenosine tRNA methylthiotransferase MtaB